MKTCNRCDRTIPDDENVCPGCQSYYYQWKKDVKVCDCCGNSPVIDIEGYEVWWWLRNYNDEEVFSGYFCPDCFNKVRTDGFKGPMNPIEYQETKAMLLERRKVTV